MTHPSSEEYDTEQYLMTVLSKKFERITSDMTQTLLRSARSGVINSAQDFSSAITLYDGRQLMLKDGLPIHLGNIDLVPKATMRYFDDIQPGDCFLTNSPYAGNTHHADYTLHIPVFYKDEPMFWVVNRAHQADVGAPIPSTYLPNAETVYEEGLHFPSIRTQETYEDREDIVRMCKLNIRSGDIQWYGDYRAQVAALRVGEERLTDLCKEYGRATIKQFTQDWLDYGKVRMTNEIRALPQRELKYTAHHDPIPGVSDEPIPVHVDIEIDPEAARITVDLTDNTETLPSGFNLTEATTRAACYGGVFQNLDADIPHNHGSIECIDVRMETDKAIGKPAFPAGTSAATTNLAAVLFNAVQAAFGDLGEPYGLAEGNSGIQATTPNVSGRDFRRDDEPFVNQLILAAGGGPAVYGHDGWLTYTTSVSGGVIRRDSIEINEQNFPLLITRHEQLTDTGGDGQWRGAPASVTEFTPRSNPLTVSYLGNGQQCPPRGIRGGHDGSPAAVSKVTAEGDRVDLPIIVMDTLEIQPDETLVATNVGGGGYGNPFDRDPAMVRKDVTEGYVSRTVARDVYGVVLIETDTGFEVDDEATKTRRGRDGE